MPIDVAKVYQAFNPTPLRENEQHDRYVELGRLRGESPKRPFAPTLAKHIRLADKNTCQLITGHRGSGKSTELFRLQHELGASGGNKPFFVVYCDVDQTLNRADMDFPDLLLVVVRSLAEQLKDKLGIVLRPGYFRDRFEELKEFFGADVNFNTIELTEGLIKLVGSLRSSGANRKKIREALEPKVDSLITATNDLIDQAKTELDKKKFAGLVITIDNLDHLVRGSVPQTEEYPGENLFIRRAPEMLRLDCHVVYTAPLALVFSPNEQELQRLYDHKPLIVGLTKLRDRAGLTYDAGVDAFREVIRKRLDVAGANEREVFANDAVRDKLIACTGGQLTALCMLVRSALVAGTPITDEVLDELVREEQRGFARWLKLEHWRIIDALRQGQQPLPSNENHSSLRDLIEGLALLYHLNGGEWWAVNPLVGDTPSLPALSPAPAKP
jgi:hypothetical protein